MRSVLLILCMGVLTAQAQMDSVALSEEYYKQGMEIFGFEHRKLAAELFVLSTQTNPKNAKAQLMAGQSIMLSIGKEKSLAYFRRAWNLDSQVHPDILYFLGQAYHYSEKFDSAIQFYDRYARMLARSLNFEKSIKINEVNRKIFECRNAMVYIAHPVVVSLTNLDTKINSEYPDYAPTITEDESLMVFTSRRPGDNLNDRVAVDHEYYEEIFISEKVNGEWQPAKNPGAPLNTGYHNASVNLSPDGKEIIIYHDTGGGDLLISRRNQNGSWSSPKPLEGINSEYLESSATITEDGKKIYFTSNRPGGYGGTDVYSCELGKNDRWTNIQNLGPLVNTELDEEGVFISASGEHLYYSSNGLAGMGDLDIYRATFDPLKKEWSEPVNLGYPINSVENDIYFVLTADEKFAYISSLRTDNHGEQDIYKVDMQQWKPVYLDQPEFSEVFAEMPVASKQTPTTSSIREKDPAGISSGPASITLYDQNKITKPARSEVSLVWHVLDDETGNPVQAKVDLKDASGKTCNITSENPGHYRAQVTLEGEQAAQFRLQIGLADFIPYNSSLYFGGASINNKTIEETIRLSKLPINNHVTNVGYVLNVYFSHDDVQPLSFDGIHNLLQMMKNSPTMRVQINGYTDSNGPESYNMNLSRRRAETVRDHLVKGGADPARITAVGYGETLPIESNDTMDGRRMNRRIEFVILEK